MSEAFLELVDWWNGHAMALIFFAVLLALSLVRTRFLAKNNFSGLVFVGWVMVGLSLVGAVVEFVACYRSLHPHVVSGLLFAVLLLSNLITTISGILLWKSRGSGAKSQTG